MRIVDLSVPTGPGAGEPLPPTIEYEDHELDRPFVALRAEFERTGDASILWEAHRAGIDREYCQIEKLHNLGALPAATGFTVSCLPVKVAGASAGWCRAAAILDETLDPDPGPPA